MAPNDLTWSPEITKSVRDLKKFEKSRGEKSVRDLKNFEKSRGERMEKSDNSLEKFISFLDYF
jgi:hypothetical protein